MTTTTPYNGRLGNQIIRNLAVSMIAEKHDLAVNYSSYAEISSMGIPLYSGNNIYGYIAQLTDANYFNILNQTNVQFNLDPNQNYFQTKEITNFLYDYLRSEKAKPHICKHNPFKDRYQNNNDLFVHIRLSDVAHNNPGANYYINAMRSIACDHIYIATDEPTHNIIRQIAQAYPHIRILHMNETNTMQFGSTCRHVLLSHGSFSAVIGYLAFYSSVHYPEYMPDKIWHGDMFSIEGWIQHKV